MKIKILCFSIIIFTFCNTVHARYYNPTTGRFISPDSVVPNANDPQSLNRYAYARNNPIVLVDPTGHSWLSSQIHKINHWADKNPWAALAIQQFDPVIGTALLDRSATGRNILTGQVIAATAMGTAIFGGAIWAGALSGEFVGGYSAYTSDGSMLSGVAIGGVVGAGTGYLGAQAGSFTQGAINLKGPVPFVAGGIVRGAIIGAGAGGVAGYKGGRGNFQSEWAGVYRGAAAGAVLGGVMGYFQAPGGAQLPKNANDAVQMAKDDVMKTAQEAAQTHSTSPALDALKGLAKDFGPRALNTLAEQAPNAAYSLVSDASGAAAIYHNGLMDYLNDQNITGNTNFKF